MNDTGHPCPRCERPQRPLASRTLLPSPVWVMWPRPVARRVLTDLVQQSNFTRAELLNIAEEYTGLLGVRVAQPSGACRVPSLHTRSTLKVGVSHHRRLPLC